MARELQVLDDCYELARYLSQRIEKFPRHQRHALGLEMERQLQSILARLIRAKFARGAEAKAVLLAEANVELEVLRFQVRLAKDLSALPLSSHGHAAKLVEQVGSQVGGWLRAVQARGNPSTPSSSTLHP